MIYLNFYILKNYRGDEGIFLSSCMEMALLGNLNVYAKSKPVYPGTCLGLSPGGYEPN